MKPITSPHPTSPEQFRAVATGTGPCIDDSIPTGTYRTAKVSATMPAKQRAALSRNSGWGAAPAPSKDFQESTF